MPIPKVHKIDNYFVQLRERKKKNKSCSEQEYSSYMDRWKKKHCCM